MTTHALLPQTNIETKLAGRQAFALFVVSARDHDGGSCPMAHGSSTEEV
jgi:hypothetical protein